MKPNTLPLALAFACVVLAWQPPAAAAEAMPAYKPPLRGAPATRVGGGSRGSDEPGARLAVLAPDHTGLTLEAQPTLYWFVSQPATARLEVTVINDHAVDPLVEKMIESPSRAGFQRLRLADYGARLAPGIEYRWYVGLVLDPNQRSKDIVASGTIQRIAAPAELAARLAQAPAEQRHFILAEAGLWYDAIEALSALIEARPGEAVWREQRAALLEQVGLAELAADARRRSGAP